LEQILFGDEPPGLRARRSRQRQRRGQHDDRGPTQHFQSPIRNPQSAIRNPQSAIYNGSMSVRDLIIVGGGPSGLSAAIAAKKRNLDYHVLEQGVLVNS